MDRWRWAGGSHIVLPYVDDGMHEVWQGIVDGIIPQCLIILVLSVGDASSPALSKSFGVGGEWLHSE